MRFAFHPILRVEERGFFGDAWAFTKSAGSGLKNAAVSTVEGVANLAKGGYKLATDGEAREKAWETTKAVASKVKDYGSKAIDDPEKAWNDARAGATSMYNEFKAAKDKAAAEGRSAEFWGEITGAGVFEVGTMLIPVGAASKLGKAGKAADTIADVGKGLDKATDLVKAADKAADLSKAAKTADKLEDAAKAANKAKQVSKTPALPAPDCVPGPVGQCPLKSGLPAKGSNTTTDLVKKAADDVATHPSLVGNFSKEAAEAANKKMARLKQLPLNSPETDKLLDELADMCVHGNGDSLVLGQWDQATGGYIAQAKKEGAKFFQTTDEFYDPKNPAMKDIAWALNERVLKKQLESGVPRIDYRGSNIADILLDPTAEGTARQKEIKYLLENARKHGYVREGNSWIKK